MKTLLKTAILGIGLALLATVDVAIVDGPTDSAIRVQLVPEAHAVFGVRRRSMRRGVVIGSSMAAAGAASAAAPAPTPAPAPVTQPAGAPPIGSIVTALPAGCGTVTKGGVQYSDCSGVYYRAAFQGSNLVYVVSQP